MRKVRIEIKIAILMALAMAFVAVIAVHTYLRFTTIVSNIEQETGPDQKLLAVNTLMSDIIEAENQVKSYTLTHDSVYYENFQYFKTNLSDRVDTILSKYKLTESELPLYQSLDLLIEEKMIVSNELISLQNEYETQEALQKAKDVIAWERSAARARQELEYNPGDETTEEGASNLSPEAKRRDRQKKKMADWKISKKLKGIFSRKDRNVASDTTNSDIPQITDQNQISNAPSEETIAVSSVNNSLNRIMQEERLATEALIEQEMLLLAEDQLLMDQISELAADIEEKEQEHINAQARIAERKTQKVNKQIALFCVIIAAIMLIMIFLILNHAHHNRKYKKQIEAEKQKTEDLSKAKERFFANLSHEIRTPLNAIAGFTDQIAQSDLNAKQQAQVDILRKSSDHLVHLVNDILDLSKLQNKKLKMEKIPFSLEEVIADSVNLLLPKAKSNKTQITYQIAKNIPPVLIGDPHRVKQIMLNLISNAVKFTHQGEVKVNANLNSQDKDKSTISIQVIDNGKGMTQEQVDKIFDEFEQADASTSRNFGGSGLGLTITQKLVELHQGEIRLNSAPDEGTTVELELPFAVSEKAKLHKKRPDNSVDIQDLKDQKILIVDDEDFNRQLIQVILKKHQVLSDQAVDGKQALDMIEKEDYDLILMDGRMPNMDGVEATKRIRRHHNPEKSCTPIIAISATSDDKDIAAFDRAGINAFVAKPFKEKSLLDSIRRTMNSNHSHPNLALNQKTMTNDTELDLSELMNLSNGDRAFFLDMLETFVSGSKEGMVRIKEGYREKNFEKMADYAHKISGPAAHINARPFYSSLKKIEKIGRNGEGKQELENLIEISENHMNTTISLVEKEIKKLQK